MWSVYILAMCVDVEKIELYFQIPLSSDFVHKVIRIV